MITRIPHPRAGNALLMTIIVLAGVAAMMTLSSQRVLGMHVLAGFNLRNQAASSAAEAGASMVEGGLYATSGDNTTLTRDIATVPIQPNLNPWLSYMGYAGTGSWPNLWIGNCMIRWRLEPVTVYAQTYAGAPAAGTNFTYNYQANANLVGTAPANSLVNPGFYHYRIVSTAWYMDDLGKHKTSGGAALTMANATPWNNPEQALATAQVERLVELKIVNLFQYVIFYAATKETGDIEFHPGASLNVTGAVQSNGSIYCGGGATAFQTGNYHASTCQGSPVTIGSSANPVGINGVGGIYRERKAVNYQMSKALPAAAAVTDPKVVPMRGQAIGGVAMSGNNDLNGDDEASSMFQLNGQNLTSVNDSRSNLGIAGSSGYIKDSNHGAAVVATLSNFPQLAGYPFESQQIVASAVGSPPTQLYSTPTGTFTINPGYYAGALPLYYASGVGSSWPTSTNTGRPVYATDLPLFTFINASGTAYRDVWPYQPFAIGSSTWAHQLLATTISVSPSSYLWPPLEMNNVDPKLDTYLPKISATPTSGCAVEGYFLNMSLRGLQGSGKTGLTIRERGACNTNFTWFTDQDIALSRAIPTGGLTMQASIPAGQPTTLTFSQCVTGATGNMFLVPTVTGVPPASFSTGETVRAYAAMMEANYAVYLGTNTTTGEPFDITVPFFTYSLANPQATGLPLNPTTPALGMIATQDFFLNCRESSWFQFNNYMDLGRAAAFKVDALTINAGLLCQFIANTTWASVDTAHATSYSGNLSGIFNGVVYAHRTPRFAQYVTRPPCPLAYPATSPTTTYPALPAYDPVAPLGYNPIFNQGFSANTLNPVNCPASLSPQACVGSSTSSAYPVVGSVGSVGGSARVGQSDVWSVYPLAKTVRVFNGSAINWGGVQATANNRPQGLTFITPNAAYLWGNYNTTTYTDSAGNAKVTPCAIYCDGLSVLSNAWSDTGKTYAGGNNGNATATTYVISVVINNTPTDTENTYSEGSAGTHNVIRYCESWNGNNWNFNGSLVVLNRMRYSRAYSSGVPAGGVCPISLTGGNYGANNSGGYYGAPSRNYTFNSDLLTSMGQPPASLSGISVQRVVSTMNLVNH